MELILALIASATALTVAIIQNKQGKKINETHKQVTVNSHSSDTPTVLDLISELRDEQRETNKVLVNHIIWHLDDRDK